jgi:predicted metallo-beta-lactamase superfamily hydrolase
MNKRIKEFAEQAGLPTALDYHQKRYEKFAELIVRECASIYEGVYTDQQRPERIDTRIKQHFGVEE